MQAFTLAEVEARHQALGRLYHEFLRVPALSMGLYVLPAGGVDPQQPHQQDEVYYVLSGQARATVGEEDGPVAAGSVLYVPATVPHRFHTITEDLRLLVFFAPAEGESA
jgi:mannose-6-phosphate isomerase-like protein (cupin superfamily)